MTTLLFIVILAGGGAWDGDGVQTDKAWFPSVEACEAAKNELLAQMATGYDRPNIRAACLQAASARP